MRKIRLFIEGHWFDDPYQSTCIYLKGIYSEIVNNPNFEIYIAAKNIELVKLHFYDSPNIKYLQYKSRSKFYRLLIDIPWLIYTNEIEVAHYQYISPFFKNANEIVTIHDLLFREFKDQFPIGYRITKDILFRRSAKRCDLLTTVSQYSRDSIIKYYNINNDKIKITPNGVSKDFFKSYSDKELPDIKVKYDVDKYILFVSRIEPRKNHLALVKAYSELALWKQNIKLIFIGRHDIKVNELENYLKQLNISERENILHLENIPFNELIAFYKQALLAVYPSLAEGFGIPPLESAALLTKTICSNATAMSDYKFFEDNLFDPTDIEALKRRIIYALDNDLPSQRLAISNSIYNLYNWEEISRNFADSIFSLARDI